MKNKKDFIYEYSDLNLFQTRVKVLTGEYADIILEFGTSGLAQNGKENLFNFDYTLYQIPQHLKDVKLRGDKNFETFLAYLLIDVIKARKKDKKEHNKLMKAASFEGTDACTIKINQIFYPHGQLITKKQPIVQGLQKF